MLSISQVLIVIFFSVAVVQLPPAVQTNTILNWIAPNRESANYVTYLELSKKLPAQLLSESVNLESIKDSCMNRRTYNTLLSSLKRMAEANKEICEKCRISVSPVTAAQTRLCLSKN
jgi:hypothetical protein